MTTAMCARNRQLLADCFKQQRILLTMNKQDDWCYIILKNTSYNNRWVEFQPISLVQQEDIFGISRKCTRGIIGGRSIAVFDHHFQLRLSNIRNERNGELENVLGVVKLLVWFEDPKTHQSSPDEIHYIKHRIVLGDNICKKIGIWNGWEPMENGVIENEEIIQDMAAYRFYGLK